MSGGFSFGANTSTPGFGQAAFGAQPTGSITFGTPVSSVGNTSFSQQPAQQGFGATSFSGFGAPTPAQQTQTTGFGFGTPAFTSQNFGFGATPATTTSSFGFGAQPTASQVPQGGFLGSQPPASTTGFGFGATPASTAAGFGFASAPATTSTGLSFGSTPAFGAPVSSAGTTSFNLGATPATSTGLNFGAPASTGLGFGTPATTTLTGTLGFGTPATSTGLSFGGAAPSTGFGLGQTSTAGLLGGTATTTPALSLNFGTSTTTSAPTLSFGTPASTAATSTALGSSFNFGGSTQTPLVGLGGTSFNLSTPKPATTSAAPSLGLGGIVQSTPKTGTTTGKTEVLPRDQPLPNEISQTVESFKNFVKQQKSYSSEIARCSVKEFKKVANEIDLVANLLNEVEKQLQTNRAIAEKIKQDTAKGLQHIEMAQRTFDTPPGLQYDNTAPMEFFTNLVDNFEREMHTLKMQIESTDKYVKNLGKPAPLNSQDLAMGMRRLHEAFVALAGRLQSVHSQVESQKEQYLNVRKYMLNDDTNIFEKPKAPTEVLNIPLSSVNYKPPTIASGPTPFNSMAHPSVIQAAAQNQTQTQNTGFGMPQTQPSLFGPQTGSSLFGNTTLGSTFGQPQQQQNASMFNTSSSFQLQKPPTGNKRSK